MFRALFAHPQEALHKRHLVYCVRVMSVGSYFLTNLIKSASHWFYYTERLEHQICLYPLDVSTVNFSARMHN
jgi:hypothetical protein